MNDSVLTRVNLNCLILNFMKIPRYNLLLILAVPYLLINLLLRLILWWQFGIVSDVSYGQVPLILMTGFINDAVELLYLLLPLSLFLLLMPEKWFSTRINRAILLIGSYFWLFIWLYLAVAEYFFFEEFDARFNLVAVDYLIYPHEVFINIWESYPVSMVLSINAILSGLLLFFFLSPWTRSCFSRNTSFRQRIGFFSIHLILLLGALVGFSTYSLTFSDNRVTQELIANGISSFFQAFHTNELDYNKYYRTADSKTMLDLLSQNLKQGGGEFTHLNDGRIDRTFPAQAAGLGKLNVVVIVEESFGAEFVGVYGDKRGLTPEFDRLSQQGLLFTRMYATGTRTVRGLEAITLSFPPIPSESIVKRPGNENMFNWGTVMKQQGYHTSFLYGGYGYFDNMNYFYSHNGFAVSDRNEIKQPNFANIWGVSDEDLLRHAAEYFDDRQGQPFFSIIMTTSNHKPYTFPEGIPGVPTKGGGRDAGIRYADYAIGQFFREASKHAWYNNTLFIIVADHGARVYGKAQIPLYSYEIPLLILAPGHIADQTVDTLTSQLDIAPTVLGLLGFAYEAPFFGKNVLAQPTRTLLFNHNHKVALYNGSELAVLGLQGSTATYRYEHQGHQFTPLPSNEGLINLATAYYQTAFKLFKEHKY